MQVFIHHIYEYEKGIRNLILHTISEDLLDFVEKRLQLKKIDYKIYKIKNGRYNIFFGDSSCIDVIKKINKSNLSDYTPEEDFILGIMLGYDRKKQCERYINFKNKENIKVS
ncbi:MULTISPECIES: DUF2023 family protein [Cetobacterium]|jgi:hypothetical protein|uniref:DUF2023 family protein n=1 Tax=Candidatus Cetobacterium colombiensis TaxID=3073100 RepID=A0ABU4WC26_9FUSO|nr:DUF2023 family protein [Candidatus Cetobacterium colombiensis]MDX8337082.1 DUF2023 family protein [Candidatus Cetobacterium colombiensis]